MRSTVATALGEGRARFGAGRAFGVFIGFRHVGVHRFIGIDLGGRGAHCFGHMMECRRLELGLAVRLIGGLLMAVCGQAQAWNVPPPRDDPPPVAPRGPDTSRPGPWDHDVLVYRLSGEGRVEQLATFERAGVPTVARLGDGRLMAAHQHFPANDEVNFDKVAVRFSADEGRSWTAAQVMQLAGLPEGMRFPFDPTLVPLPDGRVRMYFTSLRGRRFDEDRPAIHSAVSEDGVNYAFEPGARFGIEGRPVIDCAVVLHRGVFHLYAPDNGVGRVVGGPPRGRPADGARRPRSDGGPGGTERRPPPPGIGGPGPADSGQRPPPGTGYHATSLDGLTFTRQPDVTIEGQRRWLGNAQSDGRVITFFGTGEPGLWRATSENGRDWQLGPSVPTGPGPDPGAVRLRDGSWLLLGTGPPRPGTRRGPLERQAPRPRS
ncbi:MAG: exo-alpha-sialidase [Verrucomicrobia bacterium]|nr:exo-alpha-sialidase [Verrucomicrobiota bacterium]